MNMSFKESHYIAFKWCRCDSFALSIRLSIYFFIFQKHSNLRKDSSPDFYWFLSAVKEMVRSCPACLQSLASNRTIYREREGVIRAGKGPLCVLTSLIHTVGYKKKATISWCAPKIRCGLFLWFPAFNSNWNRNSLILRVLCDHRQK